MMMMKQPELGKKIAELRKSRGLTQEELVETCNLSVRTLQRIEAGEVKPRSYTLKIIFNALEYPIDIASDKGSHRDAGSGYNGADWFNRVVYLITDLFNLKTNTMKKVSILTAVVAVICVTCLVVISNESSAMKPAKVKQQIHENNKNFLRWFNNGQIDSLVTLYNDDACLVGIGCGKNTIFDYYSSQSEIYKLKELHATSISVSGSIAVEKGRWTVVFPNGDEFRGEYLTEWICTRKTCLIVNDAGVTNKR